MRHAQLARMLPIHELRERRALRLVHEQQALHARAFEAQMELALAAHRLNDECDGLMQALTTHQTVSAAELQTLSQRMAQLESQRAQLDRDLNQARVRADEALALVLQARRAHAASVLGSHKLQTAAQDLARSYRTAQTARADGQADEEFTAAGHAGAAKPERHR